MSNRPSFVHRRRLATSAAVIACTLAAVPATDAAVVAIDLGPSGFNLLGANGGASSGGYSTVSGFPLPSGTMYVANGLDIGNGAMFGLWTSGNPAIAVAAGGVLRRFAAGDSISSAGWIDGSISETVFRWSTTSAQADFGPNSFIGFRFEITPGNYNYGFIEVTWTAATNTFGILSAAYESTANTAITAPASGGGGVPLPGAAGLAACGLLAAARRRRR